MKKIIILLFAIIFSLFKTQVGINTDSPRNTLDINGNTLLESYLIDTENQFVTTNDYFLMVRSKDSDPVGQVKLLDVSQRNVAPVNVYKVTINNVNRDKVYKLNTNLDVSKYTLAITGAVFRNATSAQNTNTTYGAYSNEITTTTIGPNTFYEINLDFVGTTTTSNINGTWEVSFIVYERALVKEWGTYTGSVNYSGSPAYSGISTTTPIGLQ